MANKLSGHTTLVTIMSVMAIGLVGWIGVLLAVWLVLRAVSSAPDFWVMAGALSTALTAAALVGTGFVAYRELSELDQGRQIAVADRLFDDMNAQECVDARRWILSNLPDDPESGIRSLTPEGQAAVKRVLNTLDKTAFLTQAGWIPEETIMPWVNPMVVKVWAKLCYCSANLSLVICSAKMSHHGHRSDTDSERAKAVEGAG